jgi:hypothetical protein
MRTHFAPVHGYGACKKPYSASTPSRMRIFPPVAGYSVCKTPYNAGTRLIYGVTDSDINANHPGTHEDVQYVLVRKEMYSWTLMVHGYL